MQDPFDVATPTQRRAVTTALAAYLVLFVAELTTDSALVAGAADLLLAAFVVVASAVIYRRATDGQTTDRVAAAAAAAFALAGLAIGYEGLATVGVVTRVLAVELAGTVALLVALALYLYRRL